MLFCSKWHLLQVSSRQAWRAQYLLSYQEWVGTRTLDTWQYVKFRSPSTWCSCISPGHEVRHNKRLVFVWFPGKKKHGPTRHILVGFPPVSHNKTTSFSSPCLLRMHWLLHWSWSHLVEEFSPFAVIADIAAPCVVHCPNGVLTILYFSWLSSN